MSLARLVFFPKVALGVINDFNQTCFLGTIPAAWQTIATGIVVFYKHHNAALYVAEAFYWISVGLTLLVTCGGVYAMYKRQGERKLSDINGAW